MSQFLWENSLLISAPKSSVTLFTPDPAQANTRPKIKIADSELPLVRNPKILGVYLDTACAWLVFHIQEGLCKLYPPILPLRSPGSTVFWGSHSYEVAWLAGDIASNPGPKPTLKTLLYTLTQSPTLTKYTNSPVQPSQSSPPSLSPAHSQPKSPTSVQSPLQNTPTYHRASIQLHTRIYLKKPTGPLDVSREGGVSASQVERTPGRATLTSWVVGPRCV